MANQNVIDRVKKMIALASDVAASEGERDNALRMAYATIAKYNISSDDLEDTSEQREQIDFIGFPSPWARNISNAISSLFFCKYFFVKGKQHKHCFVGKSANSTTAQLLSQYVLKSIQSESGKIARKNGYDSAWVTSFSKGAADSIYLRCKAIRETQTVQDENGIAVTGTSLVMVSKYQTEEDANIEFVNKTLNIKLTNAKPRKSTTIDYSGYTNGRKFGDSISLNGQISNKYNRDSVRIAC